MALKLRLFAHYFPSKAQVIYAGHRYSQNQPQARYCPKSKTCDDISVVHFT